MIYREEDFNNIFLVAMSVVSDNNKIIGLQYDAKRIYEMDLETDKIKYLTEIPIEQKDEFKLYQKSVVYNNKIYFLPFNCSTIAVLDLNTMEFEMINISMLYSNSNAQIINVFVDKNIILMIPYQGGKFIQFDMDTNKVIDIFDFSTAIGNDLLCSYAINEDGIVILPSMTSNKVYFVNIYEKTISNVQVAESGDSFSGIAVLENNIWMVLKNRFGILKYDIRSKEWNLNESCPKGFCIEGNTCFDSKNVFWVKDKLICMPAFANAAIEIDLNNSQISEILELKQYCDSTIKDSTKFTFDGHCALKDTRFLCYQEMGIVEINLMSKKTILHRFKKNAAEDCLNFLMKKCEMGEQK